MLVEDNDDDLELALRAFKMAKLVNKIDVVRDGSEALDFIFCQGKYDYRDITELPKVILLDLKLPKIDGLEVLKRIKGDDRTRMIPVVMLTSSKQQSDVVESYKLGVNAYIVKPVDFEQFVLAVQRIGWFWLLHNQPSLAPGR